MLMVTFPLDFLFFIFFGVLLCGKLLYMFQLFFKCVFVYLPVFCWIGIG